MTRCQSFALAGLLFSLPAAASVDDDASAVDQIFADVDRVDSPGAVVAIVRGTEIVYQRGYGMANLEHGIPITPRTVFDIASISKQFGAMTAILVERDGRFDFDDDVRAHVPELHDFGDVVTPRHLVHHTSGIRDWPHLMVVSGVGMGDVISFEKIKRMLFRQRALNFAPGSEYAYSNTGYNLLAEMLSRVSGRSFRDVAAERIFRPLYMTDTFFADDHEEIVSRRASSYEPAPGGGFKNSVNQLTALASSSLHTTMEDFTKWMVNFETGAVGGAEGLARLHERGTLTDGSVIPYAFGLVHDVYRGQPTVGHGGSWRGFRTRLLRFPDQHLSIAVFANFSTSDPLARAEKVADLYLADVLGPRTVPPTPSEPPATIDLSVRELESYGGSYYSFELDTTYDVSVLDGGLTVDHARNDPVRLRPVGGDVFRGDQWWFEDITFTRDANGRIDGLEVNATRVRNLRFVRGTAR